MSDPDDVARVSALLGRPPRAAFSVVVRDASGAPMVIRNAPFLDDGTPLPTTYWLVDPELSRAIARLEADGGVRVAQATVDPDALAATHARYAAERDAAIAPGHDGPRPFGGVGGTRVGVKCLHAHYAYRLAGGDDPVGDWVAAALARAEESAGRPVPGATPDDDVIGVGAGGAGSERLGPQGRERSR
jgi:hypothetical protein